jgi:hypothetical protein
VLIEAAFCFDGEKYYANTCPECGVLTSRYRDTELVAVAVPHNETALREKLKAAGGRWNPEERVWRVCFGAIRGDSTLVERIVRE